jgi:transcriptional regulator with XRE-family HTH domain
MMQKNHQSDKQFLQEMGGLLAARARQGRMAPPPSLTHLAEHIASARRYQKLTRAALAQKMGSSEAEIYALEQGLLSYTELDLHFLGKLAVALNEDIETLLLLLGRPALAQALQTSAARRTEKQAQSYVYPPYPKDNATASKQHGNRLTRRQWINALYKGCLNLIDSLRQGRLSAIIRVNYQLYPTAAVLLCVFLIGMSSYSLAGRFGAQSAMQSSIPISVQADDLDSVRHQRTIDHSTARSPQRLYLPVEAMTEPVTVSVGGPAPDIALMADHVASETQQCVVLAGGRPAICRV